MNGICIVVSPEKTCSIIAEIKSSTYALSMSRTSDRACNFVVDSGYLLDTDNGKFQLNRFHISVELMDLRDTLDLRGKRYHMAVIDSDCQISGAPRKNLQMALVDSPLKGTGIKYIDANSLIELIRSSNLYKLLELSERSVVYEVRTDKKV